jgi:hypothetical protein
VVLYLGAGRFRLRVYAPRSGFTTPPKLLLEREVESDGRSELVVDVPPPAK